MDLTETAIRKMNMQNIPDKNTIQGYWETARDSTKGDDGQVQDFVYTSWKRSKKYNVDPYKQENTVLLDEQQMARRRQANKKLLDNVLPAIYDLREITKERGCCFTLADRTGIILKKIGSREALAFTAQGNFIEGADWSEKIMGTNTIGTVLALDRPIYMSGHEQYCRCTCLCSSSGAPIHDTNGEILGVLNLTGPYNQLNRYSLGAVQTTARGIERKLELSTLYRQTEKSNLLKKAIIESIRGCLIAIDMAGQIVQINEQGRRLLGIDIKDNFNFKKFVRRNNPHLMPMISTHKRIYGETITWITPEGQRKKFIVNITPFKKQAGEQIEGHVIVMIKMHPLVRKIIKSKANIIFDNIIGESSRFKYAINQAKLSAKSDSSVLLLGESGVGKDLFAQAIHNASQRKQETFFAINCAALPRELLSSELFGYEEGAFTGARKKGNPGKFELADRGTIFLDEIGEAPLDLQASLLRVLEEKEVIRLGGRDRIPFDVRVICATNKSIIEEIKNNNFRHDLFYRIGVITINIPPLRERKEDIPLLATSLLKTISKRFGKDIREIDPKVMDILINHDWPGNVRELSNIIERAINLAISPIVTCDLLPPELLETCSSNTISMWEESPTRAKAEAQLIQNYLIKFDNNKAKTAKTLNISRSSLYRKLKQYGIPPA
jgi:transcriptional regulator with PAS, ATPase and Fis domain